VNQELYGILRLIFIYYWFCEWQIQITPVSYFNASYYNVPLFCEGTILYV